jgi:two-component system KDP operon response regulator KdpE
VHFQSKVEKNEIKLKVSKMTYNLKTKVLIVDDEPQIRKILTISLISEFYEIIEAYNGNEAIRLAAVRNPEIIILDLGLPDIDGLDVIKEIREFSKSPIIVLSVRADEKDKIQALDLGANDYVTKPFNIRELMARMRSALRDRIYTDFPNAILEAGDLRFDLAKRIVTLKDKKLNLSPKEYYLLSFFMKNIGSVITHTQLLKEVWGPSYIKEHQYLRVYMGSLRQKIEAEPHCPKYLLTESGVGYRMVDPTQE